MPRWGKYSIGCIGCIGFFFAHAVVRPEPPRSLSDMQIVITITEARFEAVPDKEFALPEAIQKPVNGEPAK